MSETEPNSNVAPLLCRVHVRIQRWENLTPDQGGHLIRPEYLTAANWALDECIRFIESRSIPTLLGNERLVLKTASAREMWLLDVNEDLGGVDGLAAMKGRYAFTAMGRPSGVRKPFVDLVSAWRDLQDRWPSHVSEARNRFGRRFNENAYPLAGDIWKHFIAWGEYDSNESVNSHEILGRFSIFEPPEQPAPPPPDYFEEFTFATRLQELYDQRRSGEITEQEYDDRVAKLFQDYPVQP